MAWALLMCVFAICVGVRQPRSLECHELRPLSGSRGMEMEEEEEASSRKSDETRVEEKLSFPPAFFPPPSFFLVVEYGHIREKNKPRLK